MANTPTKVMVNCETGEQTVVPLSSEEIQDRELRAKEATEFQAKLQAEAQAKAEAKTSALAKLKALGLSEDEAKAIIG